jgi:hypothetical protein
VLAEGGTDRRTFEPIKRKDECDRKVASLRRLVKAASRRSIAEQSDGWVGETSTVGWSDDKATLIDATRKVLFGW